MGGKGSGRKVGPCGTYSKHKWHWKRGEKCEQCRLAFNAHMKEYQRARRKKKPKKQRGPTKLQSNRELVRAEKLRRGACMDCGLIIDERTIVCIDFDHRDPNDKAFTISYEMANAHASDLTAEMAKCDAVCRNCHALRTHDRQDHKHRNTVRATVPTLFD